MNREDMHIGTAVKLPYEEIGIIKNLKTTLWGSSADIEIIKANPAFRDKTGEIEDFPHTIIEKYEYEKKILYIDMDGVIADFDKYVKILDPDLILGDGDPSTWEARSKRVDELCLANPDIFHNLEPIEGAIESVTKLFDYYEVYFLSTPVWKLPESFMGKRLWIEQHFGEKAHKRLILTHRKDLAIGHYLVDDRLKNGAGQFKGLHIHYNANKNFKNWKQVENFLLKPKQYINLDIQN